MPVDDNFLQEIKTKHPKEIFISGTKSEELHEDVALTNKTILYFDSISLVDELTDELLIYINDNVAIIYFRDFDLSNE